MHLYSVRLISRLDDGRPAVRVVKTDCTEQRGVHSLNTPPIMDIYTSQSVVKGFYTGVGLWLLVNGSQL